MRVCYQMTKVLLLHILRDRRTLVAMFLMPLVTTLILSFALGPVFKGNGIPKFTVAVSNADKGPMGEKLVRVLMDIPNQISVREFPTNTQAEDAVKAGQASVALCIPTGYSAGIEALMGRTPTSTQESSSARNKDNKILANTRIVVEGTQQNGTQSQVILAVVDQFDKVAGEEAYAVTAERQTGQPISVPAVALTNEKTNMHPMTAGSYYAMGMLVLFLLNFAFSRAYQILSERQGDHFKRLAAAPVSKAVLSFGYFASNFVALLFQAAFTLICDRWILGIYLGPWTQVGVIVAAYTLALAGLTVMVGAWTNNVAALNIISNLGGNLAAVVGGSFYPLYFFPHWMQWIGRAIPNGQALNAFLDSISGIAMAGLTVPILYMVGFAIATSLLARTRQWRPAD